MPETTRDWENVLQNKTNRFTIKTCRIN